MTAIAEADRRAPALDERGRGAIPRLLHVVWLDGSPPPKVLEAAASWERLHPGWTLTVWTEASLPPLRNQAIFDACETAARLPIAGYELLHRYGGVVVAPGVACLRSLEPLLEGVQALLVATPQKGVSGALVGCAPGHPFVEALLGAVPAAIAAKPTEDPAGLVGEELLTQVVGGIVGGERTMAANLGARDLPTVLRAHLFFAGVARPDGDPDDGLVAVLGAGTAQEGEDGSAVEETRRFVCVLDTQAPAVLATVVRTFCALFGPADPVELAVCVPQEPGQAEANAIMQLLGAVAPDPDALPEVVLYSFAEAATLPWQSAVIAPGDHVLGGLEAADALAGMSATRTALDSGAPLAPQQPGAQLRTRLAERSGKASRPATRAERRAR
jgi:hypothetical protein